MIFQKKITTTLAKSDGLFKSGQNIVCLQESIIDLKKKKSFK
jgi:hypothetical protein